MEDPEKIGKVYGESDDCSATFRWPYWQIYLKAKRNKLETFFDHLQVNGRILFETNGNVLKFTCPKFRDIKDSRNKKVPKENPDVPSKIIDLELETERDIETHYYANGKKLYKSFYKHIDHENVARAIKKSPHKHWIVTYDDIEQIDNIYDLTNKTT